jgi:ubiquinol-cytochrome c reductase iron-sulfur subunit
MVMYEWRGQPIWIIQRTPEQLAVLPSLDPMLKDPNSDNGDQQPAFAQNVNRSLKPETLVLVGLCTHLGCAPKLYPELKPEPFDADWKGGFFCPCHKSRFDMAGRVYDGVPAPTNLVVPPYYFIDDNHIMIGISEGTT